LSDNNNNKGMFDMMTSVALRLLKKTLITNGPLTSTTNAEKLYVMSPILSPPQIITYDPSFLTQLHTLCLSTLDLTIDSLASLTKAGGRVLHIMSCKLPMSTTSPLPTLPPLCTVKLHMITDDLDPVIVSWLANCTNLKVTNCTFKSVFSVPSHLITLDMNDIGLSSNTNAAVVRVPVESQIESLHFNSFYDGACVQIDGPLPNLIHLDANSVKGLQTLHTHPLLRIVHLSNTQTKNLDALPQLMVARIDAASGNQKLEINNCPLLRDLTLERVEVTKATNIPSLHSLRLINDARFPANIKVPVVSMATTHIL
jgi:hypothetical protein